MQCVPSRVAAKPKKAHEMHCQPPTASVDEVVFGRDVDFSRDAANYYSRSTGHRQHDVVSATRMILAATGDFNGDHATQWSLGAPHASRTRIFAHTRHHTYIQYRPYVSSPSSSQPWPPTMRRHCVASDTDRKLIVSE